MTTTLFSTYFPSLNWDFKQNRRCPKTLSAYVFPCRKNAVIHERKTYLINAPLSCPLFANAMIYSNRQLELYPLEACLRLDQNTSTDDMTSLDSDINCPLVRCWPEPLPHSYISTAEGILVKTTDSTVTVQSDNPRNDLDLYVTCTRKNIEVPKMGSLFIPWTKNVTSVSFGEHVVYSLVNAKHQAKISISTRHEEPMPRLAIST